jgi:hypothetical protein
MLKVCCIDVTSMEDFGSVSQSEDLFFSLEIQDRKMVVLVELFIVKLLNRIAV